MLYSNCTTQSNTVDAETERSVEPLITVDLRSRTPIYEQLITAITEDVLSGRMQAGEQLPSVRALASALAINPNTVQKAFAALEAQGILYCLPGKGNFVTSDTAALQKKAADRAEAALMEALERAKEAGLDKATALGAVRTVYQKKATDKKGAPST